MVVVEEEKIVHKGRLSQERIDRIMARRKEKEVKEKKARKKAEQQRNVVEETDTLFDMEL